jgi:hypothetical protein
MILFKTFLQLKENESCYEIIDITIDWLKNNEHFDIRTSLGGDKEYNNLDIETQH